jgi:hypothetical protein
MGGARYDASRARKVQGIASVPHLCSGVERLATRWIVVISPR